MGEFGRSGPQLPHDETIQREHLKEVEEDLHRDQEADRFATGRAARPRGRLGYLVVLLVPPASSRAASSLITG
jgi:hypothetical protein